MTKKELSEKDITNVSGGLNEGEEIDKEVWTYFRCFRPSCHYEDKEWGYYPKEQVILCPMCHHDSYMSKGIYEK